MAASHHCSGSGWQSDSLWVTLIRLWLQLILVALVLAFWNWYNIYLQCFTVEFSLQSHRYSFLITFNAWKLTLAFLWGGLFQNQLLLEEIDNLRRKVFVSHWASDWDLLLGMCINVLFIEISSLQERPMSAPVWTSGLSVADWCVQP
jgi:hypothetical protein